MKKKNILLVLNVLIAAGLCIFVSCSNAYKLTGSWENEERIIRFDDNSAFEISFKNTNSVKAFYGSVFIQKNILVLTFEEYKNSNNERVSVKGTDLENHKEVLVFSIKDDVLITEVKTTGKKYFYTKIK